MLDAQLEEMDAEGCDEHAEVTIVHELITDLYVPRCSHSRSPKHPSPARLTIAPLATRSEPYAEIEEDNQKVGKLTTLCAALKKEIGEWKAFRSSTLVTAQQLESFTSVC